MEKDIRYIRSAIEDLASTTRSSRESDAVRRRCCIEHDFAKEEDNRTIIGTKIRVAEVGVTARSSSPPRRTVRNGVKDPH